MAEGWKITGEWETLDMGSEVERSCFAALSINRFRMSFARTGAKPHIRSG